MNDFLRKTFYIVYSWSLEIMLKSLLFIIPFIILCSCHITYKVRNQRNNIDEVMYFPCGKITIELEGRGNSKFTLNQKFELDEPVMIYMDSVKIFYNKKKINADFNLKNENGTHDPKMISGNSLLEASFEFEKGVFEGDTISVFGPGFIRCKDHEVTLDTLIYTFINKLRIYGVNDF